MSQLSRSSQLPPRFPSDAEDISRAICLLGNRIASDLKDKTKGELISLLGTYPSQEQAKHWKQSLKRLLKEGLEPEDLLEEAASLHQAGSKKAAHKKAAQKRSSKRKSFDAKPKRFSNQPPNKLQQLYKRQLASNEHLYPGVSNLSGIDLDLLRDEDDWRADFDF